MPSCEDDFLDDIEDIVGEGDLTGLERSIARSNAVVKRTKKVKGPSVTAPKKKTNLPYYEKNESIIPGTQKIWVKTWGMS